MARQKLHKALPLIELIVIEKNQRNLPVFYHKYITGNKYTKTKVLSSANNYY